MILFKSREEIEKLRVSNHLVTKTLAEVAKHIKPGITTLALDTIAEQYIRANGGVPGFLGYRGYPRTLCTSVNSEIVHGIPGAVELKEGDIVSIDCGVIVDGYYGDAAYTFPVGTISPEVLALMKTTRESLFNGIQEAVEGKRVGDIGYAVQAHAEARGYSVVREMVGHGLGKSLHEEPEVPNYGRRGVGPRLLTGMVICIEPMINMGSKNIRQDKDGWTIRTADGKPSAHYELPVAIQKDKADILSTFDYIEGVINIFS